MVLPQFNSFENIRMPLNNCICGSDDIAITESHILGIQNYAIIKCNKCNRGIKRRTYKKAEKAWNENNPKTAKLYEITYETQIYQVRHKTIVTGVDEFQALENFREMDVTQKYADVINIKLYNGENCRQ